MASPLPSQQTSLDGQIVVANRGSGNLSVLDEQTGEVIRSVDLPFSDGDNFPEPMYIQNLRSTNEIAVDDRANNRVVFFDKATFEVTAIVETGSGNFHLAADLKETQLWVVNDIDDTLTVIDPQTKTEISRVFLSETVIGANGSPHDVVLDPSGQYAYVTVFLDDNPDSDLLVKIDTTSFEILDTAEIGKGPHLTVAPEHNLLYALAEDGNSINIFDRRGTELTQVGAIEQPGAHGVISGGDGRYTYTSNLPGGGPNGLFVIDNVTNEIVGDLDGVDTPFPVPHNVALTEQDQNLFLTHSGATSNQISFYSLEDPTLPQLEGTVEVDGLNPFGLTYASPEEDNLVVGTASTDQIGGSIGQDLIFGEEGHDFLEGNSGQDKLFGEEGNDRLLGQLGDDVLIGGSGYDRIVGGRGSDTLIGVDVESFTPGEGEIDFYQGGQGKDAFVLGDALEVYYDDGKNQGLGLSDFVVIADFQSDQDVIRLNGSADQYQLESFLGGTGVFHIGNGQPELIGVVNHTTDLALNSDAFEFSQV